MPASWNKGWIDPELPAFLSSDPLTPGEVSIPLDRRMAPAHLLLGLTLAGTEDAAVGLYLTGANRSSFQLHNNLLADSNALLGEDGWLRITVRVPLSSCDPAPNTLCLRHEEQGVIALYEGLIYPDDEGCASASVFVSGGISANAALSPSPTVLDRRVSTLGHPPVTSFRQSRGDGVASIPTKGLRLWLRADTLALSSGAAVTAWPDQSGRGHTATQSVSASCPIFFTNTFNGLPAVRFDGANDFLSGSVGALSAPLTLIVVGRFAQAYQPANDYDYFLRIGNGTAANGHVSVSRCCGGNVNSNRYYSWQGNASAMGPVLNGNGGLVVMAEHGTNAPRHRVWLDGAEYGVEDYSQSVTLDGTLELGRYSQSGLASHYLSGDLVEVLVYDRLLSATELAEADRALRSKYALNRAPDVEAGTDRIVGVSNLVQLAGQVSDDGLPLSPGVVTSIWQQIVGPGQALCSDAGSPTTAVWFAQPGAYRLRLTAWDGEKSASDELEIVVRQDSATNVPAQGLRLWLKADEVAANDRDPIAEWRDRSSGHHSVTQSIAASRPTFVATNGPNGKAAIRFDGMNDYLAGNLGGMTSPVTLIVVGRFDYANQPSGDYDYFLRLGDGSAAYRHISVSRWAAGDNRYYSWLGEGPGSKSGPVLDGNAWRVLTVTHGTNAPRHKLWVDGYAQTVEDYGSNVTVNGTLELGRYSAGSFASHYLNGSLAEVLIYNRELGESERLALERYVKEKYALNAAPEVEAGPDAQLVGANTVVLAGQVSDDGLPSMPGSTTAEWEKVAGPGNVTFSDASVTNAVATFDRPGAYRLRLTAGDGEKRASDELEIVVRQDTATNVPGQGLRLWLKADEVAANDGDPLFVWKDRGSGGHDVTQAFAASQPTFMATNGPNGKAAIRFDGANDYLAGNLGGMTSTVTVLMVARFDDANQPANDYDYLIRIGTDNGIASRHLSVSRWAGGSTNVNRYYSWMGDTAYGGPVLPGQSWQLISVVHGRTNAPAQQLRLNGVPQTVDQYTQALVLDGSVELGRYSKIGFISHYLQGALAEVLVFDRILSPSEHVAVERYLGEKYGLALQPSDLDNDGLSDAWELQYFGNLTQTAAGDFDGDGVSNLDEFRRGTDPTDPNSVNITLYVNALNGDDAHDGIASVWGGGHGPKRRIAAGISSAINGDRIEIATGTYSNEPATFSLDHRHLRMIPIGHVDVR